MKTKLLLIGTIFILLRSFAHGQYYQPFKNNFKYQFSYYLGTPMYTSVFVHTMNIDSTVVQGQDSVFYFNPMYSQIDNFWGRKMIKRGDSLYLFIFSTGDTILLKTNSTIGSAWSFNANQVSYTVTYSGLRKETVLSGIVDSVKTFTVTNTAGFSDSIKISRLYGMTYSFMLRALSPGFVYNSAESGRMNMQYIYNIKAGKNVLNFMDYYHLNVGDVLAYTDFESGPIFSYSNIFNVTSQKTGVDSILYSIAKYSVDSLVNGKYYTTQSECSLIVKDTSVRTIPTRMYDDYPNQGIETVLTFPLNKASNNYGGNYLTYLVDTSAKNLLIMPLYFLEEFTTMQFTQPYGLNRWNYSGLPNNADASYYLSQYWPNNSEVNSFTDLNTFLGVVKPTDKISDVYIYPNPFQDKIILRSDQLSPGTYDIHIYSVEGSEVYTSKSAYVEQAQKITIDNLSGLPQGVYFLTIEGMGLVQNFKMMKQ